MFTKLAAAFALVPLALASQEVDFSDLFQRAGCMTGQNLQSLVEEELEAYICVSFSLPGKILSQYIEEAESSGASLIVNGLPKGGIKAFFQEIQKYRKGERFPAFSVRPDLFEEFAVSQVPCIVFRRGSSFDKVTGTVTMDFALQKVREFGELASEVDSHGRMG